MLVKTLSTARHIFIGHSRASNLVGKYCQPAYLQNKQAANSHVSTTYFTSQCHMLILIETRKDRVNFKNQMSRCLFIQ